MIIGISGYIGSGKDTVAQMIQYLTNTEKDSRKMFEGQTFTSFNHWLNMLSDFPNYRGNSSWEIKKFAGKLKQISSLMLGIPVADFELQSVKDSFLGPEWETFISLEEVQATGTGRRPLKVREFLQRLGTEAVRDRVHQNAWVNALFVDYSRTHYLYGDTSYVLQNDGSYNPVDLNHSGMSEHDMIKLGATKHESNWIISDVRFPNEAEAITRRGGFIVRVNRPDFITNSKTGEEFPIKVHRHISETSLDNWSFDEVIINDGSLEDLLQKVRQILISLKLVENEQSTDNS